MKDVILFAGIMFFAICLGVSAGVSLVYVLDSYCCTCEDEKPKDGGG